MATNTDGTLVWNLTALTERRAQLQDEIQKIDTFLDQARQIGAIVNGTNGTAARRGAKKKKKDTTVRRRRKLDIPPGASEARNERVLDFLKSLKPGEKARAYEVGRMLRMRFGGPSREVNRYGMALCALEKKGLVRRFPEGYAIAQ